MIRENVIESLKEIRDFMKANKKKIKKMGGKPKKWSAWSDMALCLLNPPCTPLNVNEKKFIETMKALEEKDDGRRRPKTEPTKRKPPGRD